MTYLQALTLVSKAYIPGVSAFYDKMTPDPWQAAHDRLDSMLDVTDSHILSSACQTFADDCLSLIESFKRLNLPQHRITPADAFHIGDEMRLNEITSRREKCCYLCESKEKLKIVHSPHDELSAVLICESCLKK